MNSRVDAPDAKVSWGKISESEHIAQFYVDNSALMDALTGFLSEALNSGNSAIVIATPEHLRTLFRLLPGAGVDMQRALLEDRFITLDATIALSTFMENDWPDEKLFSLFVSGLIRRAARNDRKVRAFGEMVALLWSKGHRAATVRLEQLWDQFCQSHSFALLCSYPQDGSAEDPLRSRPEICAAHSKVV